MTLKIKWTHEAKSQFKEILNYWEERNGSRIYSRKLIKLFDKAVVRLASYPEMGRMTDNHRIRLKIIRNYFLYYSFDESKIVVLGVFDMRRDPDYLKSMLK